MEALFSKEMNWCFQEKNNLKFCVLLHVYSFKHQEIHLYYFSKCIHYSLIVFDIKKYFSSKIFPLLNLSSLH